MFPTLFEFGPLTLYSLWVAFCIGLILATLLFLKRAKYERLDMLFLLNHMASMIVSAIIFSRLVFFAINWGYWGPFSFKTMLIEMISFWQPGYSFWGAVFGIGVAFSWHAWRKKEPPLPWLTAASTPLLIGIMIGNIGQLLDGQGYGRETILPWGITFESTTVKYTVPIHPTQIYSFLLIALILISRKKLQTRWKILESNETWALFSLTVFALGRFILEWFRGDDTLQWGIVRIGHVASLLAFVVFGTLLYKRLKPHLKSQS